MKQHFYKYKVENLINISRIATAHYFEFESNFSFSGEAHDFWEMVYAVKNSVVCTADGKQLVLKEGDVLFHQPNEFHSLAADTKSAPDVFILCFDCKSEAISFFIGKHFTPDREGAGLLRMIIEEGRRTFEATNNPFIKKMPLAKNPPLGGLQMLKNLCEAFLISLLRKETGKEGATTHFLLKEDFEEHITNRIIAYLKANIHKSVSIDELAKTLSYTKSYLFRQFKKTTGDTIMAYFLKLKIDHAKKLLREGKMPVSEIAASLAFDTPNYFSKAFKKITGRTPTQYKRSHQIASK